MIFSHVYWEGLVVTFILPLLPRGSSSSEVERLDVDIHLVLNVPRFLFLPASFWPWVSTLASICCRRKLLRWWLNKALWSWVEQNITRSYFYHYISLLFKVSIFFTLGPWDIYSHNRGFPNSARYDSVLWRVS